MYTVNVNVTEIRRVVVDEFNLVELELQDLVTQDEISMTVFCSIYGYLPEADDVNYIKYKGCIVDIIDSFNDKTNFKRAMGMI